MNNQLTYKDAAAALNCAGDWNGSGQYDHDQYDMAVKMAQAALENEAKRQWIRVEDQLPKVMKPVLVCHERAKGQFVVEQGYKDVGDWWKIYGTRTKCIIAWMPMPEPPEVKR